MPFGGLLTIGLISAGTGLAGAAIQSHQQGKAVDAQTAAGDKALALQKDIYNQQQANEAPWRNTGAAAITTLGGLLGLPSGGGGTGQLPTSAPLSTAADTSGPQPYRNASFLALGGSNANPTYNQAGEFAANQSPLQRATDQNSTAYGETPQRFGSSPGVPETITMRAPDGTQQQVPRDQVGHYAQMGATVVS